MKASEMIEAVKKHIAELETQVEDAQARQSKSVQEKAMMRQYWLGVEAAKKDEIAALKKIIGVQ